MQKIFQIAAESDTTINSLAKSCGVDRSLISLILRRKVSARVEVPLKFVRRAQRLLKPTPKKSDGKVADRVRRDFVNETLSREDLAMREGVSKKTVHQMLTHPDRKDVITTVHLQDQIDRRLRKNLGAHLRRFTDQQVQEIRITRSGS